MCRSVYDLAAYLLLENWLSFEG